MQGFWCIWLTSREKIITILNNLFYVFTSYSTSNAPKTMELHFPRTSRLSHFPSILPSVPVFGWLLHLKSLTGGHLRPWCILYIFLFHCSIRHPKRWDGVPPRAPRPAHLRSNTPPTASANYWVDCCLKPSNGGNRRPEPGASLYFFVRPILALQSTELKTARAHRTPRACFRPIGSVGANI